jgi:hypothetical protein
MDQQSPPFHIQSIAQLPKTQYLGLTPPICHCILPPTGANMLIIGVLGGIVSLIIIVMFFVLCSNVSKMQKNIQQLHDFERARIMNDGLMDKDDRIIERNINAIKAFAATKTKTDVPSIQAPALESVEPILEGWVCPDCAAKNPSNRSICENCGTRRANLVAG